MGIKILYRYDEVGYFDEEVVFQVMEGVYPPDHTTETPLPAGADLDKSFFRFDEEEGRWIEEEKPSSAEDFVGVVISHESKTKHDTELRELAQKLTEGAEGYRMLRGDDLSWCVTRVPEEEKDEAAADAELAAFDAQLSGLKERMSVAMLQGDQETIDALRAEYNALMNEE